MTATTAKPCAGSAPVILIVDDEALNNALMARVLRAEGFRTVAASGGEEARARCADTRVDLILLDVMMPGRSGFQVCSDLKADPATSDIPVIFLSALDDVKSRVDGLRAGGVDYIAKPFYAEEVLARVRIHLRTRQAIEHVAREQRAWLEELRQAQQSMLVLPEAVPDGCFAVYYQPLEAVGGDIYDVIPLSDDLVGYFVADISGHGVSASFLTSAVKALLRQYSGPLFSVGDTMRHINSVMHATLTGGNYLTACYARLYRRRLKLSVVSAGHPPLIHVSEAGRAESVDVQSDPLGVFGSVVLQKKEIELNFGDRFYMYTDGLIDDYGLAGGGRQRGMERLMGACERRHALPLEEGVRGIVEDVKPGGKAVSDDLLLLGVEVRP